MPYTLFTKTILLCTLLILACGQQQTLQHISTCIGNCMVCTPTAPALCLDQSLKISTDVICLPFYRGTNCLEQAFAYEVFFCLQKNLLKQNDQFDGWNSINRASCQLVQRNAESQLVSIDNSTIVGLGAMKSEEFLYRSISLSSSAVTNRAIIKFSVGIDDSSIESFFSTVSSSSTSNTASNSSDVQTDVATETRTQTLPDGTVITYITTTTNTTTTNDLTNSQSQSNSLSAGGGRKFMYVELIDASNGQTVIERKLLNYNALSGVRTSCGFLYTYQLAFNLQKSYAALAVKMYLTNPTTEQKDVSWTVFNFDFSLGCRGFVVSSNSADSYNCDACLSGFFPIYSIVNSQVEECRACDYRCRTCLSANVCLACIQNTFLNPNTRMCQFSSFFTTLNNYKINTGQVITSGQFSGQQLVKSEGGILEIQQSLANTQPYTASFDFFYTAAFRNAGQIVKVLINGQQFQFNSNTLPLTVPTQISGVSSSSSNLYKTTLAYNVNGISQSNFAATQTGSAVADGSSTTNGSSTANDYQTSRMRIVSSGVSAAGGSTGEELAISNVNFVQFQCSKNCLECNYNQFTQTSQCTKCSFFFDRESNCLICANGFFKTVVNNAQQCIKCHSTCRQCSGPQITDCLTCFDGFRLGEIIYDYDCVNCVHLAHNGTDPKSIPLCNANPKCLANNPISKFSTIPSCQQCLRSSIDDIMSSQSCRLCWLQQNLAKSYCDPIPERGYQLYGSDISQGVISSQWTSNKVLTTKSLNQFYVDLYGVDYDKNQQNQTTVLAFTQQFLPVHRGMTVFFNIFKVNQWKTNSFLANSTLNDTINIVIRSNEKLVILNKTINVTASSGNNIYGGFGSGNEMMYTFVGNSQEHTHTGRFEIIVTGTHSGLFVKDLEVYLGNCDQCNGNRMNYQIYYIPMYSTNETQTGLDVWLTFNQGVKFVAKDQQTQDRILNSFQFTIDQLGYQNLLPFTILENRIKDWNFVKYFVPVNATLINATLRVNNSLGYSIYSKISKVQAYLSNPLVINAQRNLMEEVSLIQTTTISHHHTRLLLNERLSSTNVESRIHRYEDIVLDQRKSMEQIDSFYEFFQWFTVLAMIVFAFFGLGIIFEEFSILLQLLFLHIYISTYLLPASFKQPLSHMEKMQNLNFFAYPHARGIENSWFSNINQQSPYPLTQYGIDVYFTRSFYPIIIINLIYLFWFLVLFVCHKLIRPFRASSNRIVKFFRDIPQRPMNYFDQIWRYQFITTMWASFIQFHNFDGPTAEMRLNLALCIASFVISLIWPVFVMVYTYHQHLVINVEHFLYLYNDIYYRKISSIADETSYYLYIAVRFGRYLFYALFIAVFVYQNIIGPVILMAVSILEIIYIVKFDIYRDKVYLMFKIIENFGFVIVEILLLIVYGFSDDTITKDGFLSIGYGLSSLFILMIINGIARFIYLGYKKIRDFITGRYDYGQKGDLQNYDNKNPIAIELPTTQRGLI